MSDTSNIFALTCLLVIHSKFLDSNLNRHASLHAKIPFFPRYSAYRWRTGAHEVGEDCCHRCKSGEHSVNTNEVDKAKREWYDLQAKFRQDQQN